MDADEELIKEETQPVIRALFADKSSMGGANELENALQKLLDEIDSKNTFGKNAVMFF